MLKKNLFYNILLSISQFIFPLITFPFSSRILGPNGIGSVNFVDSFTQYFILFSALGIPLYGVREISKKKGNKADLEKTFNEIFLIHVISTAAFALVYLISALIIPQLRVHIDMVLVGIMMMVSGVLSSEWYFQGTEKFSYITARSLIVRSLSVILLFSILKNDSQPVTYYMIMASGMTLNGLVNFLYIKKTVKIAFFHLDLRQHLRPLVVILGSTIAVSVYMLMDNVLLGFIKGEREVGIYSVALRIVRLPLAFIGAVNAIMIPQISRSYMEKDFPHIQQLTNKSLSLICIIGFPIVSGIYVSAPFLIHIFGGDQFDSSILPLQILAPMVLINGFGNIICIQLLGPMEKERLLLRAYILAMIFSLFVNILLIKYFSFLGASYGMIFTELVATSICYYILTRVITLKVDLKIMWQCFIGAALFLPIAYGIRNLISQFQLRENLIILTCSLFYICYLWFFVKNSHLGNWKNFLLSKIYVSR